MQAKEVYKLVFQLNDFQEEKLLSIAGRLGLTVPELLGKFIDDITNEEVSDDPERAGIAQSWLGKIKVNTAPSFLTYLMTLSGGDLREFIYSLIFLREQKQQIDEIEKILHQLDAGSIEDMDVAFQTELRRICCESGVEVEEENRDIIRACLQEEKVDDWDVMFVPDLGCEPDLYSPVDVLREAFDNYCSLYMVDDADLNREVDCVINWINGNEDGFQPLD